MNTEEKLITYFKSLGLTVNTGTKARGHMGFFLEGRIDISKNLPKDKIIPTLLHEFSHYIHSKLEKGINKTGGNLKIIFNTDEDFEKELLQITSFIDKQYRCEILKTHKEKVKREIKKLDNKIKSEYPNFKRSKPFSEFNKAIKGTKIKYLLKYDKVRILPRLPFWKEEILSVDSVEKDFPNLKTAFVNYIKLKSLIRKQKRISNKISKNQRYFKRPTELFARFVVAFYVSEENVKNLAPKTYKRFTELLENGYYMELKHALEIAKENLLIV